MLNWITKPDEVNTLADALRNESVIGIDTEFIRETTFFPRIALIQVGTQEQTHLIDPTVLDPKGLQPVLQLFEDPKILKVMHADYSDQECFFWSYGLVAKPVLDTAVAAALCGYGDNIGLGKLLKDVLRVSLPKGRARVKWLERPLPKELIHYAHQDVLHLVDLERFFEKKLKALDRWDWALHESQVDPRVFEPTPEELASRHLKGGHLDESLYPILIELFKWREEEAKACNLPRQWVADNDVIISLARVKPKSVEELNSFRGLSKRRIERSADQVLRIIKLASQMNKPLFLQDSHARVDEHAQNLLKAFVSFLADQEQIASRFLVPPSQYGALLSHFEEDSTSWVERGILSPFSERLIGKELQDFLRGKKMLKFEGGEVRVATLS